MSHSVGHQDSNSLHTTAVIVTYQSREVIDAALHSLHNSYVTGDLTCIVVDNNSDDGTPEHIERTHPWVRVVRSDVNLGFARGSNLGISLVTTPYVLLLNPDSQLDRGALRTMTAHMDSHPQVGIIAPAIVNDAGGVQFAGRMLTPSRLMRASLGSHKAYPEQRTIIPGDKPFRTSWVCGAVLLVRMSLLRTLGGFDDRFFLYFEETDLCRRANAHGAEIWAVGEAVARHAGGMSAKATSEPLIAGCIAEHYFQSRFYYLIKHFGWFRALTAEGFAYSVHVARIVWRRLFRQFLPDGPDGSMSRPVFQLPHRVPDTSSNKRAPSLSRNPLVVEETR